MNKIKDGGPAFPLPFILDQTRGINGEYVDCEDAGVPTGLTLRDYFAAKAMQGLMARIGAHDAHIIAHDAYSVADAMLEARK
jgi:hypothetical protein